MTTDALFTDKLEELRSLNLSIMALVEQMSSGEYSSLAAYLNNLDHLKKFFDEVGGILDVDRFEEWLRNNDTKLYISIHSVQNTMVLFSNMLRNLQRFLNFQAGLTSAVKA